MSRLLLIDSYAMIYRAYYAFMKSSFVTSKGQNTSAIYGYVVILEDMIRRLKPDYVGAAFDPKGKTFRHEIYDKYKAQREATPEDIHKAVPFIKSILTAMHIPILEVEGYEADDVIGTIAKAASQEGMEVYMATPDKDYGQLVDDHIYIYRPKHSGGFEVMGQKEVCEKYGLQRTEQVIDFLGLMGDASDNIPGCTGVGEKTATKLLQQFGSIENMLNNTDQIQGSMRQKIENQTEQIRLSRYLATIKTDVPIGFDKQQYIYQQPDISALTSIYRELEFKSLLRKYDNVQLDFTETTEDTTPAYKTLLTESRPLSEIHIADNAIVGLAVRVTEATAPVDLFSEQQAAIITIYLTTDGKTIYQGELYDSCIEMFRRKDLTIVTDDYKSTYKTLQQEGIKIEAKVFDVSIAHYLIQAEQQHDTASLALAYLKLQIDTTPEQFCAADLLLYSTLAEQTNRKLFEEIEMPLTEILAEMEMAGVRFNTKTLKEAAQQMNEELEHIEQEIHQMAGGRSFNINSPRQVGELLFETLKLDPKAKKTKSGQYVTSEEVLQSIQDKHPIVGKILEYREVKKLLSTYIEALPALINPTTGKIHTTYNQTITATGRLSSSNPNLQNLPIRSERGKMIRAAVIADKGCKIVSADYSQIELRLMAHFSQDEHLMTAFREGQDIHSATAAKIFGCPIEEVTRDMRRKAKTANFGIIYGISAFGLAQQLQSSRAEAKELIDGYFASFPKVIAYIESAKQKARETGYAETLFGRRRYLPDINSRNATVRSFAERNAVNAPIQGTAADIIKIAMINIYHRFKQEGLRSKMIMQVHDELNFNVPNEEVERVQQIVKNEMENAVQLSIPLIAECGSGDNWLEAH